MAILTWLSGEQKNQQVLVDGEVILGRGKHVQVVLDDQRSSREHARVFQQADDFFIEDLGSRNGTFLNETQVGRTPVRLNVGDNIRIGLSWFCFGEPKIQEDSLVDTFVGYKITQQLLHHQGGMLLEAEQVGLERKVHLRVLSVQLANNQQAIHHQFIQEVKTLAKLVHRNIALLLDFGSRNLYLYSAFEALEGEELTGYVEAHQPLDIHRALDIAREVARGMDYAQRQGVSHLRLQPEVVLLTRGRPIIRDFGMSRLVGEMTRDSSTGISDVSGYMAPEMLEASLDEVRADVYSFGMLIYYLLAGKPPYESRSPYQLIEAIQAGPPPSLGTVRAEIPRPLIDAVARMTERDPQQRVASFAEALELLAEVERLLDMDELRNEYAARSAKMHPLQARAEQLLAEPQNCWILAGAVTLVGLLIVFLLF